MDVALLASDNTPVSSPVSNPIGDAPANSRPASGHPSSDRPASSSGGSGSASDGPASNPTANVAANRNIDADVLHIDIHKDLKKLHVPITITNGISLTLPLANSF